MDGQIWIQFLTPKNGVKGPFEPKPQAYHKFQMPLWRLYMVDQKRDWNSGPNLKIGIIFEKYRLSRNGSLVCKFATKLSPYTRKISQIMIILKSFSNILPILRNKPPVPSHIFYGLLCNVQLQIRLQYAEV